MTISVSDIGNYFWTKLTDNCNSIFLTNRDLDMGAHAGDKLSSPLITVFNMVAFTPFKL